MKEQYSPYWLTNSFKLPHTRVEVNALCRHLVNVNPLYSTTIDFYSIFLLKYLKITYSNADIFKQQDHIVNLQKLLSNMLHELWVIGETFPYCELSEEKGQWASVILQNPDYIIIKQSVINSELEIFLRPDEKLRSFVFKKEKTDTEIENLSKISPVIINDIKNGRNILLDKFYVTHLCRKQMPYEIRGMGIIPITFSLAMQLQQVMPQSDRIYIENQIKTAIGHPETLIGINKEIWLLKIKEVVAAIINWLNTKYYQPIAKINNITQIPVVEFNYEEFSNAIENI